MYANLARLNLPYPEAVFDISYFKTDPSAFYTLAYELYPGRHRPTISHSFLSLLAKKHLLLKLFTQNIDCLDREAGVPADKIVEAHGSFARQRCIECKHAFSPGKMRQAIDDRSVPHCETPQCNGLVKPDIVFFGEQLPTQFYQNISLVTKADLCIVMGTSLTVQPFASLPDFCPIGVPRLLFNMERVGALGSRANDVLSLGDCDAGVRKLAAALGWHEELESLWRNAVPGLGQMAGAAEQYREPRYEDLDDQVLKLTEDVDRSLKISRGHAEMLREHLKKKDDRRVLLEADEDDINRRTE